MIIINQKKDKITATNDNPLYEAKDQNNFNPMFESNVDP